MTEGCRSATNYCEVYKANNMRIYFLSERLAALKLNGAYLGLIDGFEKFAEIGEEKVFAEALPADGSKAVNFLIDGEFFKNPPPFTDVYLTGGDAVIYISRYEPAEGKLEVIAQESGAGACVTLFSNCGEIYLSCEKERGNLYELSGGFANAKLSAARIGGYPVTLVEGEGCLAVISEDGERVFYNPAESWSVGDRLKICVRFNTCANVAAECEYSYDGRRMKREKSVTSERVPPEEEVLHFAFFESVLTGGDYKKYLCAELADKAEALPSFLGEFTDVTLPYSSFYTRHGDLRAAGLVYPVKSNLFNVKYFAVDMEGGKITNVYEVED